MGIRIERLTSVLAGAAFVLLGSAACQEVAAPTGDEGTDQPGGNGAAGATQAFMFFWEDPTDIPERPVLTFEGETLPISRYGPSDVCTDTLTANGVSGQTHEWRFRLDWLSCIECAFTPNEPRKEEYGIDRLSSLNMRDGDCHAVQVDVQSSMDLYVLPR